MRPHLARKTINKNNVKQSEIFLFSGAAVQKKLGIPFERGDGTTAFITFLLHLGDDDLNGNHSAHIAVSCQNLGINNINNKRSFKSQSDVIPKGSCYFVLLLPSS